MTLDAYIAEALPYSLVDPARLRVIAGCVASVADCPGAMAEIGVYRGGSARFLHRLAPTRRLHLFDTFRGHPTPTEADDTNEHYAGKYRDVDAAHVLSLLASAPVTIHVGRFPESLDTSPPPLAFVHLDADLYESVRDGLAICWPALVPGGVVVVDDYGFSECPGAKAAVDGFVDRYGREMDVAVLSTGQAQLRKRA